MAPPSEAPSVPRSSLPSPPFPSLAATASPTNLLILSLAVLISSGVLLRQFHPKYKPRATTHNSSKPKKSKEKDDVLKSIILAQAIAVSESATKQNHDRGRKTPARSRAGSHTLAPDDARNPLASTSACIASTSAAIVQGLSRLSAPGASTPDSNHDTSRSRSRPASGAVTPAIIIEEETPSVETGVSKKKDTTRKGKGAATTSTQTSSTSTGTSTSLSPSAARVPSPRRKPMRDASTMCESLSRVDVGVQTERTVAVSEYAGEGLSNGSVGRTNGQEVDKSNISNNRRSTPPPNAVPLPSTEHYNLHSYFQSTPPRLPRPRPSSPPLSPTPISPPKGSFLDRPTSPPILLNGSKASTLPIPTSSGSSSTRRKNSRKASITPGSPGSKYVVGMPRPVVKEGPSERLLSPSPDRRQSYADKTTKSPESIALGLPRQPPNASTSNGQSSDKGKRRESSYGNEQNSPQLSSSASNGSLRSPNSVPVHLPPLPNQSNVRRIASSSGGPQSPNSPQYAQYHLAERQSFGAGAGMIEQGLRRNSTKSKDNLYWSMSNDATTGWTADAMARMVGLGMGMDGKGSGRSETGNIEEGRLRDGQSWSEAAGAPRSRSISGGAKGTDGSEGGRDGSLMSPRQVPPFSGLWPNHPSSSTATEPPSTPITRPSHPAPPSVTSSQSRSESRQSSLSVPLSAQHFQQQLQLQQQQQAFAYAQGLAQAQYQHALALQFQAANNGLVQSLHSASSTNSMNGLGHSMQAQRQQTNGWNSLPHSPLLQHQFSQSQLSPTNSNFPVHPYYVAGNSTNGSNYYGGNSPNGNYGRQPNSGKSNGKRSPANGAEKARNSGVVLESTGWKIKLRTAEMEADRSGKELEIARWRLVVLEEDRIANEIENQEALAALASRAQRAEARLKALEEIPRQADSSSNSGSGSPTTRPSSVTDLGESGQDALPSIVAPEGGTFSQSAGAKIHPLAWLDLDSITFSIQTSNSRPSRFSSPMNQSRRSSVRPNRNFSSSNSNSHSNDSSGHSGKQRRMINPRRRSTNSGIPTVEFEGEEEEIVILLDSPIRKRPAGSAGPSRRSSYRIEEGDGNIAADIEEEDSLFGQLEVDGVVEELGAEESHEPVDFIGSLPTFLEPFPSSFLSPSTRNRPVDADEGGLAIVTLPSFIVDQATPSPADDATPKLLQDLIGPISPPLVTRMEGYFIKRPASA